MSSTGDGPYAMIQSMLWVPLRALEPPASDQSP
jgi:hypothetical protein